MKTRYLVFATALMFAGIALAQDASPLLVTGVQLSENDFQVNLENRSSKTITAFALRYTFTYKDGHKRVWGNNVDYLWGLLNNLPDTDDPAAVARIKPGAVRYLRQPFLPDNDGVLPTAVDNVGVTAVIFDDATAEGPQAALDDMFAYRKEIEVGISRWWPEFEAAERSENPTVELQKLAKRLGTVKDAPDVVGGISSTQRSLKQMVDSMLAIGVAAPGKAFAIVRSYNGNIKAHSSRRNSRGKELSNESVPCRLFFRGYSSASRVLTNRTIFAILQLHGLDVQRDAILLRAARPVFADKHHAELDRKLQV